LSVKAGERPTRHVRCRQDNPGSPAPIKTMTMPAVEFILRFLTHVLENGRRHIRNGFLAPGHRAKNLKRIRRMIGQRNAAGDVEAAGDEPQETGDAVASQKRPVCGRGEMIAVGSREQPRVSDILAMRLADLYDMRLTEWDEF